MLQLYNVMKWREEPTITTKRGDSHLAFHESKGTFGSPGTFEVALQLQ
jgi:hypothetical protein